MTAYATMSATLTDMGSSPALASGAMPQEPHSKAHCCPFNGNDLCHEPDFHAGCIPWIAGRREHWGQVNRGVAILSGDMPRSKEEGGQDIQDARYGWQAISHSRLGILFSRSKVGRYSWSARLMTKARLRCVKSQSTSSLSRVALGNLMVICSVPSPRSCIGHLYTKKFLHHATTFWLPNELQWDSIAITHPETSHSTHGEKSGKQKSRGRSAYVLPPVVKTTHMNKTFCLTDAPVRTDIPRLHSFRAVICGVHLSGVCVLPAGEDKYQYGLRKIVRHLFLDHPLAAVSLTKKKCYADNQIVWKEEE